MKGYVLGEGEGRAYMWNGFSFTVKAGHPEAKGAVGFMEFACDRGNEPTDHVHDGEDEIFVLLEGAVTVRCGSDEFDVAVGDFVFLPRDVRHGFTIRTDSVRMLVVTAPDDFSRRIESEGERVGDDVSD